MKAVIVGMMALNDPVEPERCFLQLFEAEKEIILIVAFWPRSLGRKVVHQDFIDSDSTSGLISYSDVATMLANRF